MQRQNVMLPAHPGASGFPCWPAAGLRAAWCCQRHVSTRTERPPVTSHVTVLRRSRMTEQALRSSGTFTWPHNNPYAQRPRTIARTVLGPVHNQNRTIRQTGSIQLKVCATASQTTVPYYGTGRATLRRRHNQMKLASICTATRDLSTTSLNRLSLLAFSCLPYTHTVNALIVYSHRRRVLRCLGPHSCSRPARVCLLSDTAPPMLPSAPLQAFPSNPPQRTSKINNQHTLYNSILTR